MQVQQHIGGGHCVIGGICSFCKRSGDALCAPCPMAPQIEAASRKANAAREAQR